MRKLVVGSTLAVAAAVVIGIGTLQAGVVTSRHNLTATGPGNYRLTGVDGTDQVCVFCHTPHKGNSTPLWNRAGSAAAFTMYTNATSPTLDETVDGTPNTASMICLSCHDGATAFDQLYNGPTLAGGAYDYDNTAAGGKGWTWTGGDLDLSAETGPTNVGANLTDDHPISITYRTVDTAFNAVNGDGNVDVGATGVALVLYNNKVECSTCHDPHDDSNPPFLPVANTNSQICTACHVK